MYSDIDALCVVRADLIDKGVAQQADVFNYLFNFIKQTDLFVAVTILISNIIT